MRIFISAGEASGDAYGAALVRSIRRLLEARGPKGFTERFWAYIRTNLNPIGPFELSGRVDQSWEVDSMELMEVVMDIEANYGVDIADSEVRESMSNLDFENLVREKVGVDRFQPVEWTFEGMGGRRMAQEKVRLHADTSTWGAISIVQSLAVVPRGLIGFHRTKRALKWGGPGVFVPIDFGWVNIRLARHAKQHGWKVLYFIPPGSWRRDRQGRDLPAVTDKVVTPFPWSEKLLKEAGADAYWFGHPIKQLLNLSADNKATREQVAVLPGSRTHEIEANLPVIAQSVTDLPVEFALAPTVDLERFRNEWRKLAPHRIEDRFSQEGTAAVLSRSRAGIVCSGTATLEAALCGCPMVVIYRATRAMVMEAKLIGWKRPKYIALPNILLDRPVVPELVQDEATPEAIRGHLESLLREGPERKAQLADLKELDTLLGPSRAIDRAAGLILDLASRE